MPPESSHSPTLPRLAYEPAIGPGQLRAHRPDAATIEISLGAPPLFRQLIGFLPLAIPFGIFSVSLSTLLFGVILHQGLVPMQNLLLLPIALLWAVFTLELIFSFRHRSARTRIIASDQALFLPFPGPRSPLEEIPARIIVRVSVAVRRTPIFRRTLYELEVGLEQGSKVTLLRGYPPEVLHELSDLIGPVLGLACRPTGECGKKA